MSFSHDVKEELSGKLPSSRHCMLAELSAIVHFALKKTENGEFFLQTENLLIARKCFTLLKKCFNIENAVVVRRGKGRSTGIYIIRLPGRRMMEKFFTVLRTEMTAGEQINGLCSSFCCQRSFLRGTFLAAGSVSDPENSYHFEIACDTPEYAEALCHLINHISGEVSFEAKITSRKKQYVVYVKESRQIVDLLNILGAHVSLMNMESTLVVKDMRNVINRRVNCETANLRKTVKSAVKQLEDIRLLESRGLLNTLKPALRDMAYLRLENPDMSLKELGEQFEPPVGKSGVNHRLRKLSELAESYRG